MGFVITSYSIHYTKLYEWVSYIKNTLANVSPNFTTARMMRDYQDRYYNPQFAQAQKVKADDFKIAKELANWKADVAAFYEISIGTWSLIRFVRFAIQKTRITSYNVCYTKLLRNPKILNSSSRRWWPC